MRLLTKSTSLTLTKLLKKVEEFLFLSYDSFMVKREKAVVAILMGSDSDLPVMQKTSDVLKELNIPCQLYLISAHRTPDDCVKFVKNAERAGFKVLIAGAGGSAHLPGVVAAFTTLPVIGVPIKTDSLGGLDSLLSIVQMPPGVPVATVGVNSAKNAGLLAASILGVSDKTIAAKLKAFRAKQTQAVRMKNKALHK